MRPRYLTLLRCGELQKRVVRGYQALRSCKLCPRECGIDRLHGKEGFCLTGKIASVASHNTHTGEEPPITGTRGSGTIFFASCNMHCIFCQNYPISQLRHGRPVPPHDLAEMMLRLQNDGCHNINLVTASHVVPQFIAALFIAATKGLNIPIVYNSSGYDGLRTLKLLNGIVDVYLPDIKYSDNKNSKEYSGAENYWDVARLAVKQMHTQVGDLKMDSAGIAMRGLIIRHLVLPKNISGTKKVLKFIAEEISKETYISLMSQYFPAHLALKHPTLQRSITPEEFQSALDELHTLGLNNGWLQKM